MKKTVRDLIALLLLLVSTLSAGAWPAHRWCGLYARTLVATDPGKDYNVACKWLDYGSETTAHEGAMVVWCTRGHHHVGKITGECNAERTACIVTSGNDSGRVQTRMRSVVGAAFRS